MSTIIIGHLNVMATWNEHANYKCSVNASKNIECKRQFVMILTEMIRIKLHMHFGFKHLWRKRDLYKERTSTSDYFYEKLILNYTLGFNVLMIYLILYTY